MPVYLLSVDAQIDPMGTGRRNVLYQFIPISFMQLRGLLGFYSSDSISLKDNRIMRTVTPIDSTIPEEETTNGEPRKR